MGNESRVRSTVRKQLTFGEETAATDGQALERIRGWLSRGTRPALPAQICIARLETSEGRSTVVAGEVDSSGLWLQGALPFEPGTTLIATLDLGSAEGAVIALLRVLAPQRPSERARLPFERVLRGEWDLQQYLRTPAGDAGDLLGSVSHNPDPIDIDAPALDAPQQRATESRVPRG